MDSKDIIKKTIRQIEIRSNRLVNEGLGGKYQSTFKGRGMEFSEVREYQPGDDIRTIDWNVTARQKKPFIKVFTEEREMTVIFLIDMSASLFFGSLQQTKASLAAEIVSVLAFSAIRNNDRVGMLTFTDKIEKIITPKKGKNNILRMVDELLSFKPEGIKTSISIGLKAINEIWRKKAVVFLVSDFKDESYFKDLRLTAKKHDLICIDITDPREFNIPKIGLIDFYDYEYDKVFTMDSSNKKMIDRYYKKMAEFNANKLEIFKKANVDVINIINGIPYLPELIKFFNNRHHRRVSV
ncbi:MAG: DUF58 domain-containing protein [Endomicrobiaceae bacterium]|nr:DUF58 domain-containing protein [Endomicrobiaceae bacterium]